MVFNRSKSAPATCYADGDNTWLSPILSNEIPRSGSLPCLTDETTFSTLSPPAETLQSPLSPPTYSDYDGKDHLSPWDEDEGSHPEYEYPDPDQCSSSRYCYPPPSDYSTCPNTSHERNYYCDDQCDNTPQTPAWTAPFEEGSSFSNDEGTGFDNTYGTDSLIPSIETDDTSSSSSSSYSSSSAERRRARRERTNEARTTRDFEQKFAAIQRDRIPSQYQRLKDRMKSSKLVSGKREEVFGVHKYNQALKEKRQRMERERIWRRKEPKWRQWKVIEESLLSEEWILEEM